MDITLNFEQIEGKDDVYRLIIKDGDKYLLVAERQDPRGEYVARLGLFGLTSRRLLANFDPKEIDRFLFLHGNNL
jgi:hypothetical protein